MFGRRLLAGVLASLFVGQAGAEPLPLPHSIVFYYGENPVLNELSRFQLAVLEPDSGFSPRDIPPCETIWFAYVSVGEVSPHRPYYQAMPKNWIIGRNAEWHSDIIDQTAKGWPQFFVDHVIAPLWERGYRGFFLDTMDTYELVAPEEFQKQRNRQGLVAVIRAIRARYPEAALIMNRGFELLPAVHGELYALAFESLFRGWSEAEGRYTKVSAEDRAWLMQEVRRARQDYGLPVIAIDYCKPTDSLCSREVAHRIRQLGMVPYIGDGRLQTVNLAVLP